MSPAMGSAVLGWDAWAGDSGIKHANAVELGGTPESAVARAMERAVQKYGPQDWSGWEFRESAWSSGLAVFLQPVVRLPFIVR